MRQFQRGDGQHAEAGLRDEEGILIGAVGGAAVLDNAQPSGGKLVDHPVVQHDDAVGNVFFQAVARERAIPAFRGDDGGDAFVFQPAEKAFQFAAQDAMIGQAGKERLDGIEDDALGADGIDGVAQAKEQPFEVIVSGFFDLVALDIDVIERDLPLRFERRQVETERGDICRQFLRPFLKGDKDPRFIKIHRAAHQKFHRQQRFAAPRPAAEQRRTACRHATVGDIVQSGNAGRALGQCLTPGINLMVKFSHTHDLSNWLPQKCSKLLAVRYVRAHSAVIEDCC